MKKPQTYTGFTIVELLIVIVVIAILAAITIVSYNGIQRRADQAVLQSNVKNAVTYLKSQHVINGEYPTSPSSLPGGDGSVYELTANNTSSPKSFCVTVSRKNISYFATESNTLQEGVCSGHTGSGPVTITNLITNPSFEVDKTGWISTRATATVVSSDHYSGSNALRLVVDTVGFFPRTYIHSNYDPVVEVGKTYQFSLWAKSTVPVVLLLQPLHSGNGNAGSSVTQTFAGNGTWQRHSLSITITDPTAVAVVPWVGFENNSALNTTIDIDAVMVTEGSTLRNYADGATSGWSWLSTPHLSTSSGPIIN